MSAAHAPLPAPEPLPASAAAWRTSRIVLALGAALTALVVVAVVWIGWLDYRGSVEAARNSQALMARVLEDHATRSIDTAALALASLADRIAARAEHSPDAAGPLLREALVTLPFMRGFGLLDAGGQLIAGTAASDRPGLRIDLARLGGPLQDGQQRLGGFVAGRSLADLAGTAPATAPPGLGFIPVLRALRLPHGQPALLVGLVNPDHFANHQSLTLADAQSTAVLASDGGEVLAASQAAGINAGQRITSHPVFRQLLAQREHASYVGDGLGSGTQIVAYRASRTRPLAVLVEQPEAAVRARWWQDARGLAAVYASTVLLLGGMTMVAWRGLRARERTRALLDQSQLEVAQRERELRITVRSVQELIFRTDASGAISFVNARWSAVAGRDASQAIGQHLADLVLPAQRAMVQALFSTAPQAGSGSRSAQVTVQVGTTTRLFDVAVVPLVHQDRIVGFAGSAVDVTAQVQAQQRLQTQLAVTALMLETSPLPLSLRDAEGRYLSVNQAWEEFTGLGRGQVLGQAVATQAFASNRAQHHAHDQVLLAQGGRLRYEATLRHADGSQRDVVVQKAVVPGDQGPAGILTVVMDVSEFRAAERATREARDAAEEASRAKSEFVANISHELRTPLQSILGFSELGMLRGRAQPKLLAMFEDIHASGKRMLALVNDLLDVAKIESSVGTFHLERSDLRPLVREVARELSPLLAERGLQLDLALADVPLLAKVDPLRFQQVVRNVLANAIRFSPPAGLIGLQAQATPEGEVHLRISDQGPGIPEAELEHIFGAFAQSSTTKDGSGGTGLGLAICRKILAVHGGHIAAENRPEGGAVFNIRLALKAGAETLPAPLG